VTPELQENIPAISILATANFIETLDDITVRTM
jgi:hypothetical protein